MLEYLFLGIIIGTIAGLLPGLHTNTISLILIALPFNTEGLIVTILSAAMVQNFIEAIPSTFLGAPSADTFESVLPAHRLLLEGKGLEAIELLTYGGLIGVGISILLTPLFFLFVQNTTKELIFLTPFILFFALFLMVLQEKGIQKQLIAVFIIFSAATQGMLFQNQLFPLIGGYFGLSSLLYSLKEKNSFPIQETNTTQRNFITSFPFIGTLGGMIVALLPGIGPNTAARMINLFLTTISQRNYLSLIGAITASNFFFGYITLFALNKTRNGAMVAIQNSILLTSEQLLLGILILVISSGIGATITIIISKKTSFFFQNYSIKKITTLTIIFLISIVYLMNGIIGIICLFFATSLGLFTRTTKVSQSLCMSALIVPTLFFYLFILI